MNRRMNRALITKITINSAVATPNPRTSWLDVPQLRYLLLVLPVVEAVLVGAPLDGPIRFRYLRTMRNCIMIPVSVARVSAISGRSSSACASGANSRSSVRRAAVLGWDPCLGLVPDRLGPFRLPLPGPTPGGGLLHLEVLG